MEDTEVKLATFSGWQKLGRVVRKGAHSGMKSAGGDYLFTKEQTRPIRSNPVEEAVEQVVADIFEVGKVYRMRKDTSGEGVRRVIARAEGGRLRVAGWSGHEWTPTGSRGADGTMNSSGHESGMDLLRGAIEWPQQREPGKVENPPKEGRTTIYPDPSAKRDAEHMPEAVAGPRQINRFPDDWEVTSGSAVTLSVHHGNGTGLERIAAMPNYWGK